MVLWCCGIVVLWYYGILVSGIMVLSIVVFWYCGEMVLWCFGMLNCLTVELFNCGLQNKCLIIEKKFMY